ncbi:aminodeoxychorismate/anthranilate synthase component II [Telmatospirillum sp.]|uniref:anthranilate synthase component II n=1 Tax=Telmatospirillum sp. TaxID=2079197 RepID=UPI002841CC97|nr:aminodeoxychorismate/anthranilate synthase component II [Telmatospirillum sp.]MDR3441020.1 aminodeoxychorismate/anthranilate synthase component II [Telmatospirillum sp.]
MFLLIDNYDSFTYNLWHYLGEQGADVKVVRNDAMSVDEVLALSPEGVVISPGPCDPSRAGICLELINRCAGHLPLLGVCLGHQAIGQAFGGKVVRAPKPVHGKTCDIHHDGSGLFRGLPSPFRATRYHSLVVDRAGLPPDLIVNAWTDDGLIMGLAHKEWDIHGVQFHPESIASQHGHQMLGNFLTIARHLTGNAA